MTTPTPARDWLTERLAAAGGTASAADVSQWWTDELGRTIDAMAAAGDLEREGDRLALPRGGQSPRTGRWDEPDIDAAVDAYVVMLRAEHAGQAVHRREATASVIERTGRPLPAVEAMFANISAVVQELGFDYLGAYPPKSNVPAGVRPAVGAALKA